MATRTTAVGTQTSSDFESAAEYNDASGGCTGRLRITAGNQGSITTATDLTSLTLTLTPNTNRCMRIDYCFTIQSTVSGDNCLINLVKDGVTLDQQQFAVSTVDNLGVACGFAFDNAPTNASHTYKLQLGRTASSTGTWTVKQNSTQPAYFAVTDDGPSF